MPNLTPLSAASATITSSGVNPTANDTVTVIGVVYTFKAAVAGVRDVKIGASAAASMQNLVDAINGSAAAIAAGNVGAGTTAHGHCWASIDGTGLVVTVRMRAKGDVHNAVQAIAKSAVTLTLSGATLGGGTGSLTVALREIIDRGQVNADVRQTLEDLLRTS